MNRSTRPRCKDMIGWTVRLAFPVTTRGGTRYPEGSRWRIDGTWRGRFTLARVDAPGGIIRNLDRGVFEVIETKERT